MVEFRMSLPLEKSAASSVAESMRSKGLTNFIVSAAMESGVLDDVPVLGMLSGLWKAGKEIQHELYFRKILNFLAGLDSTTQRERIAFAEHLESDDEIERFGETILIIIEKCEDTVKPKIIGRIMAAHIKGYIIDYDKAMRLASIINRCYTKDLEYLRGFREGTQGEMAAVAESLFSAGLLSNKGITHKPEVIYALNEYGKMLVEYGWSPNKTTRETFEKTDRGEDLTQFESIDDLLKDLVVHE